MKLKEISYKNVLLLAMEFILPPLTAFITMLCTESIHRGGLDAEFWSARYDAHRKAYIIAWLLLILIYCIVRGVTHFHPAAVLVTGCAGCIPAAITYYKLKLRGEPFLPWDLSQFSEATDVVSKAGVEWQSTMTIALLAFAALAIASFFVKAKKCGWITRTVQIVLPTGLAAWLVLGVFLQPTATLNMGIVPDMWMQNRYYKNYGVITGFLTNIQALKISEPEGYSAKAVEQLAQEIRENSPQTPLYPGSYAAATPAAGAEQTPDIIFVMDESFWDVAELQNYGVTFDREVTPNLHALMETSAYGKAYSPSFGGGTCDVEFEALTGYSKEFLPAGCKPFQQHVTRTMFSLPNFLKQQNGYQTAALHGYYKKFWSRNTAYPNLGIDTFLGLEDMVNPEKKRDVYWSSGLVTDAEMARQTKSLYESMLNDSDAPVFLHVVTMQNHTSYNEKNYPQDELVKVIEAPAEMDATTKGALEDFATGVRDADAMLGELTDYFAQVQRPVLLVFWGDHYNPVGSSMQLYTSTGYAADDNADPAVHGMPLLIWSNYYDGAVQLGTVGAYEIAPVLMELYGLEKPLFFEYLTQQMAAYTSRTLGVTVEADGKTTSTDLTDEQTKWFNNHWMLEYDLMFGKEYLLADDLQK